ncbi:MAG: hypothetical protein K2W96_03855 [Gemmataceae bacterium]|nr:hypothetical protein [Gemmataceae bacterium]
MAYPCAVWLLGLAFLACLVVAAIQRPPLTARGRIFYALTGLVGLAAGGHWIICLAAARGLLPRPGQPARLLSEVAGDVLAKDAIDLGAAWACAALGAASCLWAMLGPEHREEE